MLKQCIENNTALIAIDEKYNDDYKKDATCHPRGKWHLSFT